MKGNVRTRLGQRIMVERSQRVWLYGKKPGYPVVCWRDEWQPRGEGNATPIKVSSLEDPPQRAVGFFTERDDGDDVFIHFSALQMDGYRVFLEGQQVEFSIEEGPKVL